MAGGRILMAEGSRPLADVVVGGLRQQAGAPEPVVCEDGFKSLSVFARMLRGRQPPLLAVLETSLAVLPGTSLAISMRALERGLGHSPVPILFYTAEPADERFKGLLARLGRAVHLQKAAELPPEEQGRRLCLAVDRLLAQLGGK